MITACRRSRRHLGARLLALPVLLALGMPVLANAAGPSTRPAPMTTVRVAGIWGPPDAFFIDPSSNSLLSGRSAFSCAFIGNYDNARDPVVVAYMRDFAPAGRLSNDVVAVSEYAPMGDASNLALYSARDRGIGGALHGGGMNDLGSGCSQADLNFAAGISHITRRDKTLKQAYEAYAHKDYPKALALFDTSYHKIGYPAAAIMLAQMHLYGIGTPKDSNKAIYWFDRVAGDRFGPENKMRFNPANPQAMNPRIQAATMLATIYKQGIGVPADPARARHWYEKAADFGYVPATDILARGWADGSFGDKDGRRGLAYLTTAAKAGYAPAQYRLGKLYLVGADGMARDPHLGGAYIEAAARAGDPSALYAAGRMYDQGEGVPADQQKAIVYYKEAALKGNPDAEYALGTFFYQGGLVNKDPRIARGWFDVAAHRGQPDAMYNMGAMLSKGEGGPADLAMAYVWLSLASSAGHDDATAALQAIGPQLSASDKARAESVLKPGPKS